jgi:hypothetical protein
MRYQLNVPIEFDYARGGYYFTKSMTELPLFQLTEAELVSIFVAQKALEAYKGSTFEQPLRSAFQKLRAATKSSGASVSVSWEDLDSGISFRHFGAYLPDATILQTWQKRSRTNGSCSLSIRSLMRKRMKNGWLSRGISRVFPDSGTCLATTKSAKFAGYLSFCPNAKCFQHRPLRR